MNKAIALLIAAALLAGCNKQGVIDESELGSPAPQGSMVAATPADDGMGAMGGAEIPADAEAFTVHGTEFSFEPKDLSVPAGTTLAVTFVNAGQAEHDWTVVDDAGQEIEGSHAHALPGEADTAVFQLEPGTYEVHCTVSGHKEAGMTGTITAR